MPNKHAKARFSHWSKSLFPQSMDLDVQIDLLLKKVRRIRNLKSKIGNYRAGVCAVFEIVGEDTRPTLGLTVKQMQELGKLGIGFSVDYYFFGNPRK